MDFQLLRERMDGLTSWKIPGNAAIGYWGGEKVFSYASGYADMASGLPMSEDLLFNVYSCSKVVTAAAAMQLYEKGLFSLNDPLYEYIPEFRHMSVRTETGLRDAASPITLEQLFTMTAGFNYEFKIPAFEKAREKTGGKMNTLEVIRALAEEPLDFDPGTHWKYSFCHDVLAAVVEVISGKRFRDYVKENIFAPLEMHSACYHHESNHGNLAPLYRNAYRTADGVRVLHPADTTLESYYEIAPSVPKYVLGPEYDSGGAGIAVTVSDFIKFGVALARSGMGLTGERILRPETIALMKVNRLRGNVLLDFGEGRDPGCGYGLGVRVTTEKNSPVEVGEFGWGGAAGALFHIDTKNEACLFYVTHILNMPDDPFPDSLADVFYRCISL